MGLSIDMRKIARARVVPWEESEWGIAWVSIDGQEAADPIGDRDATDRVAEGIAHAIFNRTRTFVGAPWTERDDGDLRAALTDGKRRPREIAKLLMRSEEEVGERIGELELQD